MAAIPTATKITANGLLPPDSLPSGVEANQNTAPATAI